MAEDVGEALRVEDPVGPELEVLDGGGLELRDGRRGELVDPAPEEPSEDRSSLRGLAAGAEPTPSSPPGGRLRARTAGHPPTRRFQ